ncbi:RnfH family protein [Massilia sp. YMA4]|uniref:RnfH family protein n=1 Tax=Massilia sp. YMA4 TaxID=1593482 RepID=UPI000DD1856E|nr:RnfH family protein [Massilia sp. YMA4]AXA90509.1 RnfH family protein [Massilia sp. YMA4]
MAERIKISLCYASGPNPLLRALEVDAGTTIGQAIELSGMLQDAPEINLVTMPVGIYGKKKTLDTVVQARDRVEIYRPLIVDPKNARRRRARKDTAAPTALPTADAGEVLTPMAAGGTVGPEAGKA